MRTFEKIYRTDPYRERDHDREKHPSIELTDEEIIKKTSLGSYLKQKIELADQLMKDVISVKLDKKKKSPKNKKGLSK